jgi:hypothetical protein
MKIEGGCYCRALRYVSEGEPMARSQCHCRECQYISGGSPNVVMVMPAGGFAYTEGVPRLFSRSDLDAPVTREFCPDCGTHILTRSPRRPGAVVLKVGTFDDPSLFGGPQAAIWTQDKQDFHQIPPGIPTFERFPG